MNSPRVLVLSAALTLGLTACAAQSSTAPSLPAENSVGKVVQVDGDGRYFDIQPETLSAMLEVQDFFFVNVHVPDQGEIPRTDASIPFDQIQQRLDEFPDAKDSKIVVYCRSGSMSAIAAETLVRNGYDQVYNLEGGFRAWEAAGNPLVP